MIPLMDVKRQYKSIEEELDIKALSVLRSGQYVLGDDVIEFENEFAEYIGSKYVLGVANGTDALVIALNAAGVKRGDEVITTAMSFFSTAEAIATIGAVPVFVDCNLTDYTICIEKIRNKLTNKTKAIIPVHIYGHCANMDAINEIASEYNLIVIEDAAQAAGATYKGRKAGSMGDLGCISFFPTKNLGCAGDGGAIITNSLDLYRKCAAYRMHGSGDNGKYAYCKINNIDEDSNEFDYNGHLPKYFNYIIGFNSRLDTIQAGLLRVKLKYLDDWNKSRQDIAIQYNKNIINPIVSKPYCTNDCKHVYYVYVVCVQERDRFRRFLNDNNISTGVYFPVPLHMQTAFKNLHYKKGDMPNSEYLADCSVAIPMFPEMTDEEVDHIICVINQFK